MPNRHYSRDDSASQSQPLIPQDDSEEDVFMPPGESVHIATEEEKKRLWMHNASLNVLFIASW